MDIKKKEIIVIQTVKTNTYGDLEFTDIQGKSYKIGKARADKFPAIQLGAEVELIWVNNPHKPNAEYIYSATQTGKHIIQEKPNPITPQMQTPTNKDIAKAYKEAVKSLPIQDTPQSKSDAVKPQSTTKDRAVAISYSKDLVIGKIITIDKLKDYADRFLKYIEIGE